MSTLVSKLVSSKMPAGFNQAAIREYLSSHWGLGKERQTTVISFAITAEPPARLPTIDSAKEFLDLIVIRYGKYTKVALFPGAPAGGAVATQFTNVIDSVSLDAARKEHKDYLTKQFETLAKHLNLDSNPNADRLLELEANLQISEEQLNILKLEHDDEYIVGIKPKFDSFKSRRYDSYWNWVREDLVSFFYGAILGHIRMDSIDTDNRVLGLLNRWNSDCDNIVDYFASSSSSHKQCEFWAVWQSLPTAGSLELHKTPRFKYNRPTVAPSTIINAAGKIEYVETPRRLVHGSNSYSRLIENGRYIPRTNNRIPYVHLRRRDKEQWKYDKVSTKLLVDVFAAGTSHGLTYCGKTVLVIGAGPGSIGAEIIQGLLSGGARVIVTTSRAISATSQFYNSLYKDFGSRGSEMTILPFNQGSKRDCNALIEHIYSSLPQYGGGVDFIVPFAAIPESGRQLDALDSKSELAHRLMLVNLLRLIGYIKKQKEKHGLDTRPTNVILPLSPNHGTFGGDGLYAESKIGLETLFNRWHSKDWSRYVTICGAVIGWTRGTGLMSGNNIVAEAIESQGIITFSQPEMAFNILALMTEPIASLCEDEPLYADLNGGLQFVDDLKKELASARGDILNVSRIRKALLAERVREETVLNASQNLSSSQQNRKLRRRANLEVGFPDLPSYQTATAGLRDLQGMVDLQRTVVVVGYSDLSPWGSSRTRWEMEHLGGFTEAGYIEMAWIMGLVRHHSGELQGKPYAGWVDSKTKDPVHDDEFEQRYGKDIMTHSGVRYIEPEGLGGYDPDKKEFLHEVVIEEDLSPFEVSKDTAEAFKLRHGDKARIAPVPGSEEYLVRIAKGAQFMVPKSVPFDRKVAGQLPKGWNPVIYGIPQEIVSQVDPITIYALCCVCQALLSAGIEDPLELYKHIHVSELANCLGTGVGGLESMCGVYRDRYLDRPV